MSARSLSNRHDPFWEVDGPAARKEHRTRRVRGIAAVVAALAAVLMAAFAWSIQLGFAASMGIYATLPF